MCVWCSCPYCDNNDFSIYFRENYLDVCEDCGEYFENIDTECCNICNTEETCNLCKVKFYPEDNTECDFCNDPGVCNMNDGLILNTGRSNQEKGQMEPNWIRLENCKIGPKKRKIKFCKKEVTLFDKNEKNSKSIFALPEGSKNTEVIAKPILKCRCSNPKIDNNSNTRGKNKCPKIKISSFKPRYN